MKTYVLWDCELCQLTVCFFPFLCFLGQPNITYIPPGGGWGWEMFSAGQLALCSLIPCILD